MNKTPEDYLKEPYSRVLVPEAEGGYSAEILEFPGCYSQGDTPDETISNLEEAAIGWIEAALSQGQQIPEPGSKEASGRAALRLPRGIHRKASQMAQRDGVSLNTFFVEAIAARVGAEDLYGRIAQRLDKRISMLEKRVEAVTTASLWDKAFDLIKPDKSQLTSETQAGPLYMFLDRMHLEIGGRT